MELSKHMRRLLARIGEDAVFAPAGGADMPVRVLYRAPYATLPGVIEGSLPSVECMAADVPGIKHDDTFAVRATLFRVRGVEPCPVSGLVKVQLSQRAGGFAAGFSAGFGV